MNITFTDKAIVKVQEKVREDSSLYLKIKIRYGWMRLCR